MGCWTRGFAPIFGKGEDRVRLSPYIGQRGPRRATSHLWGGAMLGIILFLVLGAPLFSGRDPLAMDSSSQLLPPGTTHALGTDPFGRDILSRLLWGGRRTLGVAGAALFLTVGLGLLLGLLAGFYGGILDEVIMRAMDVMLAFPGLLLILGLVAVLGAGSKTLAMAVGLAGVPVYGRVVRSAVLSVRSEAFVEAARSVGCRNRRILSRHILPNILGSIIAFAAVQFGWAILNSSALSFLGLGESPTVPEWGAMLNLGRGYLRSAPWVSTVPGLAIAVTVLAVNILGDALQRFADPTLP